MFILKDQLVSGCCRKTKPGLIQGGYQLTKLQTKPVFRNISCKNWEGVFALTTSSWRCEKTVRCCEM